MQSAPLRTASGAVPAARRARGTHSSLARPQRKKGSAAGHDTGDFQSVASRIAVLDMGEHNRVHVLFAERDHWMDEHRELLASLTMRAAKVCTARPPARALFVPRGPSRSRG